MALQIKAEQKICNINILCDFIAYYDRFGAKDGLRESRAGYVFPGYAARRPVAVLITSASKIESFSGGCWPCGDVCNALALCPASLAEIAAGAACGKRIELWFGDEARIGQKNKITRRRAKKGTRPSAPKDQRTASTYIFGAICPAHGKGAAIIVPYCNTAAMNLHLAGISTQATTDAHTVLMLDQAGWHLSAALDVP